MGLDAVKLECSGLLVKQTVCKHLIMPAYTNLKEVTHVKVYPLSAYVSSTVVS